MLSPIDIGIIVLYFTFLLVVGYLSGRNETKEDFLIGGRSINVFPSVATFGSSLVGSAMLLAYVALVFKHGAGALWLYIGYIFGFWIFFIFAKYLRPLAQENSFYTLPDFFYHKYGKQAGQFAAVIVVLVSLGWIVVNFIGGGKTIQSFTGINFATSTTLVGVVIALYLAAGGFKAVVKTDTIQFFGILLLFVLMVYLIAANSYSLSKEDFNIFNIPPVELVSFFLVGVILPLASGELWQRVYAVKDLPTLRKTMVGLSGFLLVIGVVLLLIGLIIKSKLPNIDPDTALVSGFAELLPKGWAGLAVVVFYSAIMSSADTYLFTTSTSLTQDLLYRGEKEIDTKKSRVWIFALAIMGILIAVNVKALVDATYFLVALLFALGVLVLLIWKYKKLNAAQVSWALGLGIFTVLIGTFTVGITELLIAFAVVGVLLGLIFGRVIRLNL